jgi:hypothetical protein
MSQQLDELGTEIQIIDEFSRKVRHPSARTGAINNIVGPEQSFLKPIGQWNQMEIQCEASRITVKLNGRQTVDVDRKDFQALKPKLTSGRIALMGFGKPVEGPWFRNLQIAVPTNPIARDRQKALENQEKRADRLDPNTDEMIQELINAVTRVNSDRDIGSKILGHTLGTPVGEFEAESGISNPPQRKWIGMENTGFFLDNNRLAGIRRVYLGRTESYLQEIKQQFGQLPDNCKYVFDTKHSYALWGTYYLDDIIVYLRVLKKNGRDVVQLTAWDRRYLTETLRKELLALAEIAVYLKSECERIDDSPSRWNEISSFHDTEIVRGVIRPNIPTLGEIERGEAEREVVWLRGKEKKMPSLPWMVSDDLLIGLMPGVQKQGSGIVIQAYGYRHPTHVFSKQLQWESPLLVDGDGENDCPTLKNELQRLQAALYQNLFPPVQGQIRISKITKNHPAMKTNYLIYDWKSESGWKIAVNYDNFISLHKPEKVSLEE